MREHEVDAALSSLALRLGHSDTLYYSPRTDSCIRRLRSALSRDCDIPHACYSQVGAKTHEFGRLLHDAGGLYHSHIRPFLRIATPSRARDHCSTRCAALRRRCARRYLREMRAVGQTNWLSGISDAGHRNTNLRRLRKTLKHPTETGKANSRAGGPLVHLPPFLPSVDPGKDVQARHREAGGGGDHAGPQGARGRGSVRSGPHLRQVCPRE
eukprot:scaffold7052_cov254-Pinguiococcus_pyrenoidosus.AAC.107